MTFSSLRLLIACTILSISIIPSAFSASNAVSSVESKANESSTQIKPYTATYSSTWKFGFFDMEFTGTKQLKSIGQNLWELSFLIDDKLASYDEISRFRWENNQVETINYSFKQGKLLDKDQTQLIFNHETNKVDSIGGVTRKIPSDSVYDRLSYQIQLQTELRQTPKKIKFLIAEKKKNKWYEFVLKGTEKLSTKAGTFDTVVYEQIDNHKKVNLRRKTTLWLSEKIDFNLVKVEQVFKNNTHTVELVKFKFD